MQRTFSDIENEILDMLHDGPMMQTMLSDRMPFELYIEVGNTIRSMAARGIILREKSGRTYIVRLNDAH